MKYLLSFREQNIGGSVVPGQLLTEAGLGNVSDLQIELNVTVLIHGYNVSFSVGKRRLLQLADMLPSASACIAVVWPGDHWVGPLSYSFEGRDADDTAFELARYLDDVLRPDASISIIGHSLGCRVAMELVKRLSGLDRVVQQVCLMAAAIDDDSLSGPRQYLNETLGAVRVACMSSRKDKVLKLAYPAGDLLEAFLFWQESSDYALGYHGPRECRLYGSEYSVPDNVLDLRIARHNDVGHGDYVPGTPPSNLQVAAARYANAIIAGEHDPVYDIQ